MRLQEQARKLSFDFNPVGDHPKFNLMQLLFRASFELSHPTSVKRAVRNVNNNFRQEIAVNDTLISPASLDSLAINADGTKMLE
jgi:hypothetical protein